MAERRPIPIARSTTLCGQVTYEQARPGEIVTRLREVASWCPDDESYEGFVLLAEAADEIERLRALLLAVMPSRMGSTPDLAWPVGYHGDDPWQQWEDAVAAELFGSDERG